MPRNRIGDILLYYSRLDGHLPYLTTPHARGRHLINLTILGTDALPGAGDRRHSLRAAPTRNAPVRFFLHEVANMANRWYFTRDSKTYGPYSAGQFRGLAASGRLRPRDTVWKEGMEKRVLAAKVKDLFTAAQLRPPVALTPAADATPPPRAPAEAPPDARPEDIPDDMELVPLVDGPSAAAAVPPKAPAAPEGETAPQLSGPTALAPAKTEQHPQQQEAQKRRVLSIKGGVLQSQDGATVRFRKKCLKCGQDDTSVTSMAIPPGFLRVNFFCHKCKKSQQVEVHGVIC